MNADTIGVTLIVPRMLIQLAQEHLSPNYNVRLYNPIVLQLKRAGLPGKRLSDVRGPRAKPW